MHSVESDECMLSTGQPGDRLCILAPPPEQGFQVHIGPTDYNNPDPMYVLEPGAVINVGSGEAISLNIAQRRAVDLLEGLGKR